MKQFVHEFHCHNRILLTSDNVASVFSFFANIANAEAPRLEVNMYINCRTLGGIFFYFNFAILTNPIESLFIKVTSSEKETSIQTSQRWEFYNQNHSQNICHTEEI